MPLFDKVKVAGLTSAVLSALVILARTVGLDLPAVNTADGAPVVDTAVQVVVLWLPPVFAYLKSEKAAFRGDAAAGNLNDVDPIT